MRRKHMLGILTAMVALLLILVICFALRPNSDRFLTLYVGKEEILPWNDGNGTFYVFLPSYADISQIRPQVHEGRVFLDGSEFTSETILEPERTYQMQHRSFLRTRDLELILLPSRDIPSMHIQTASGSLDKIHQDKTKKESMQMVLYSSEGEEIYRSVGHSDQIRGRGNQTWVYSKKPYNLYLRDDADLLGTGSARKWVLLANMQDRSFLRNWTVSQLAQSTSQIWNPSSQMVELYVNHEYLGLYQLYEKITVAENRFPLSSEDVLLNMELTERSVPYAILDLTDSSSGEIVFPEKMNSAEMDQLGNTLHAFFDGIRDHTLSEEQLAQRMDLDSWAWLYLIQEISLNMDSAQCSLYFYLHDGKLYAGPIWDYDVSLGTICYHGPELIFAGSTPLWEQLLQYDSFRDLCMKKYGQIFRPQLETLINRELPEQMAYIQNAVVRNDLRWDRDEVMDSGEISDNQADQMYAFLSQRIRFLDRIWIDGAPYHSVYFRISGYRFYRTSAVDGDSCPAFSDFEVAYGRPISWTYQETGEPFDPSAPITQDISIRGVGYSEDSDTEDESDSEPESHLGLITALLRYGDECLTLVSLFAFPLAFSILWFLDRKRRQTGRK